MISVWASLNVVSANEGSREVTMAAKRRLLGVAALLAVMALTAAACGSTEGEKVSSSGQSRSNDGQLTTINEGHLTVGSDIPYPPFEFRKGGQLVGLDIDLVTE